MEMIVGRHVVVVSPAAGVKVVRFVHPDPRPQLDAYGGTDDCALFQELQRCALADLARGQGLVLNLGSIEIMTSAFLGVLLRVRDLVRNRRGRLVLCQPREEHQELLAITHTFPLFTITRSEEEAVHKARG
jgi:anti-anti-sigma factor